MTAPRSRASGELYLVRHAEDRAARAQRFGDEGLSERGRLQAASLRAGLAPVPLVRCLCSPLRRALETAELALEGRRVPIERVESLAEGAVGDLAGLSYESARARYPQFFRLGDSLVPRLAGANRTAPGGETRADFLSRAQGAADRMAHALARSEGPVLVVSHGGLLNFALQHLLAMPLRDEVPFGFDHGGVVRLIAHREEPAFGPFAMLRFALPGLAAPSDADAADRAGGDAERDRERRR